MDKVFPFNCSSDIKNKTLNIINHYCGRSMKENIGSEELKMADIKLIIKIDENIYNNFIHNEYSRADVIAMHTALVNATPLPKGHGRLIDANALENLCYEHDIGNSAFDGEPIIAQGQYDDGDTIWKSLFDFAPTIIEADKAGKE